MTKRLYYEENAIRCRAKVLCCRKAEAGYEVLTDATVIFPEGGGQPSDTGSLGSVQVLCAREEGEEIWHLTPEPLSEGQEVEILADATRRLDHSQQHSGEHILSGLAHTLYGAVNVGFHMAETYATLDLDLPLSETQLLELEREANRVIYRNAETTYRMVDAQELSSISLRKQTKGLTGEVRIVYVGDVDSCTCCGTHVKRSGEIGYIKITDHIHYKGGTRAWFACGMRAVEDYLAKQTTVDALAKVFCTKPENVVDAVNRQREELFQLRGVLRRRTDRLLDYQARELLESAEWIHGWKLVVYRQKEVEIGDLKRLAEEICGRENAIAVLFGEGSDTLCYQLMCTDGAKVSMREFCQVVNAAMGGKGGGRDGAAQGSAPLNRASDVEAAVAQLAAYIKIVMQKK